MFSKKQIEEMSHSVSEDVIDESIESGSIKTELDKKANLSGATFTGDVKVNGEFKSSLDTISLSVNELFVEGTYAELVVDDNIMYFVLVGSIPQQESTLGTLQVCNGTIPEKYRDKLHTIPSASGTGTYVLTQAQASYFYNGGYAQTGLRISFSPATGSFEVNVSFGNAGTLSGVEYISIRVPLILK